MRIRSKRTAFAIFGSVLLAPLLSQIADAQGTTGQAGVAAAVRGNVTLVAAIAPQAERIVGQALGSGDKIFLGDNIETGPNSGMQIMLLDETIFTIGPSAGMVIDTFVYDPATSTGQVTASIVKGAFRFVSGRVAKDQPQNMSVRTPLGTIGIRGTSAAGRVDPPDAGGNATASIVLLGPGPDNNANERAGRIIVTNGGTSVEITRSGFGTVIGGLDQPPSPPVRFEPGQIAALTGGLGTDGSARPGTGGSGQDSGGAENQGSGENNGPNNGQGGGTGPGGPGGPVGPNGGGGAIGSGQANELSGQNIGSGVAGANLAAAFGSTSSQNDSEVIAAVESSNSSINTAVATYDQLRSIQTGTAFFSVTNVPLAHISGPHTNSGGSYSATLNINFGARTLNLQVTSASYFFNGGATQSFAHNSSAGGGSDSYVNDTGFVTGSDNSVDNSSTFTTAPSDGSLVTVTGAVLNDVDAGKIAAQGRVTVTVNNGTDVIEGTKIGAAQ